MVRKGRESKHWESVTPDMMSDEEKRGDIYIRHQPHYRSDRFNSFIEKLDERSDNKPSSHARFKREIGSPVIKPNPLNAKPWMLRDQGASVPADTEDQHQNVALEAENEGTVNQDNPCSDSESLFSSE